MCNSQSFSKLTTDYLIKANKSCWHEQQCIMGFGNPGGLQKLLLLHAKNQKAGVSQLGSRKLSMVRWLSQ